MLIVRTLQNIMSKLIDLHQFISKEEVKSDPYWRSILQSDNRSIFPKHELAKIQLAKNRINKLRLIMQQLPHFLSLQIYARKMQKIAKTTHQKQMKKELEHLSKDFEQCKKQSLSSDYQFQILQTKEKVQYFCSEMNKPKINPELKELLQQNKKWKQYLQTNNKKTENVDPIIKQKDKCELAKFIELQKVDDVLITGTSGKIIQNRLKEEVFQYRLKQIFQKGMNIDLQIPNDPWHQEWQEIVERLKEPVNYV